MPVMDGTVWHVAGNWINVDGAGVLRYAVVTDGRLETKKWPRTPWSNLPIQGVGGPSMTQGDRWAVPGGSGLSWWVLGTSNETRDT